MATQFKATYIAATIEDGIFTVDMNKPENRKVFESNEFGLLSLNDFLEKASTITDEILFTKFESDEEDIQ